jgi:tetratricopeptide (TPR) repeat protein
LRSINEAELPVDMQAGIKLYQDEDYQASLTFFEEYITSHPESSQAAYYAGLSALKIGEEELALDRMLTARVNDDQLYESATWAIAGIYLNNGKIQDAQSLLEELIKIEDGFYAERAREVLEKIKEGGEG